MRLFWRFGICFPFEVTDYYSSYCDLDLYEAEGSCFYGLSAFTTIISSAAGKRGS